MDITRLNNILERLAASNNNTLYGFSGQAFGVLQSMVSADNILLNEHLTSMDRWDDWKDKSCLDGNGWQIPSDYKKAKSLSFTLYKWCAGEIWGPLGLYMGIGITFDLAVQEFNRDFLGTFIDAINDIIDSEDNDVRKRDNVNLKYVIPDIVYDSNDAFNEIELSETLNKLKALESILIGKTNEVLGKLDRHDEAFNEIRSRMRSLEDSMKTMGKKDWQTMLFGTLVSLSIQGILSSNIDLPALIGR